MLRLIPFYIFLILTSVTCLSPFHLLQCTNFECKRCRRTFDCDVGSVSLLEDSDRPHFEKGLLCPTCGELTIDDVWLTELGQSQLTEATLDLDDDFLGSADSQCQGCDRYLSVNDLGLCNACAGKLDRDLIRQRDWDYAVSAFGLDAARREELRSQVIGQYGEKLELIAPSKEARSPARRQRKNGNVLLVVTKDRRAGLV